MLKHTTLNESDQAGVKKLLKASNGFQLALTNTNIKEHPKHMFKKKICILDAVGLFNLRNKS